MGQTLQIPVRGLYTSPNEHGEIPKGGLIVANNVVFDDDGVLTQRRGQADALAAGADKLHAFSDRLLMHKGSVLSYTDTAVTTKTDYTQAITAPTGRKVRLASQNGNAYLTSSDGTKRIETVTGSIFDAGVPMGLDAQATLTGASGFLANNQTVAYRTVWGYRDANGNLMLGAPSGRAIVAMPAALTTPVNATFTPGAGTLPTGTYYYRVSAVNSIGETLASAETSLAITGPAGVNVNWGAVAGATGYKVYGRTTGAELLLAQTASVTTWLDSGSNTPAGALPGSNTTIGTRDVSVSLSVPTWLTSSHFLQIYRTSASVTATTDPGDEMGLVYEGPAPVTVAVSRLERWANVVTVSTPSPHGFSPGNLVLVSPGGRVFQAGVWVEFPAGVKLVTGASPNTFTYAETGNPGWLDPANNYASVSSITITDSIPPTFAGATLYTSPSQEGILASHYEPPLCNDIASYRGSLFWFGTTDRATLDFWLLAGGAPSGVQTNDTITINGLVFTAKTVENVTNREFKWFQASDYSPASPSLAVRDTAASLIRVINRAAGSPAFARDTSSANEQPGHTELVSRNRLVSLTVSVSRASSWAFTSGLTKAPEVNPHRIAWSPKNIPDAYQPTAWADIGEKQKAGLAILATRDSLFAIKEDGVWRLTGDSFSYGNGPSITPFDTTTQVVGAETAAVLDNVVFALSTKGVVMISDTGTTIISGPIKDQVDPLLVGAMLPLTKSLAHGVAYEAEGRYILWVPAYSTDTQATKALVYDHFQSLATGSPVWTVRTDAAATAIVNPYDGKLCVATSTTLTVERKTLDYTDYADGSAAVTINSVTGNSVVLASAAGVGVGDMLVLGTARGVVMNVVGTTLTLDRAWAGGTGAATLYKPILTETAFAPIIPAPGGWCHFQETSLLFRHLSGGVFYQAFATEIGGVAVGGVPFYGTRDYDTQEPVPAAPFASTPVNLRTWVPRNQQRAAQLRTGFVHEQALCPWRLEGLSLIYRPVSVRLRR